MTEIKDNAIDKEVQDEIAEKRIDLALSDEKEMRRAELNFYCEYYSALKKLNTELDNLYNVINMVSADKLSAYFKELSENYKKEEQKVALQEKIKKSHKTARKKQKRV